MLEHLGHVPLNGRLPDPPEVAENTPDVRHEPAGLLAADLLQRIPDSQADHLVGDKSSAYVERVGIDAARRLLERTDDGLGRVGRQCGYTTVETFHRSFRRLVVVTPPTIATGSAAQPAPIDPDR